MKGIFSACKSKATVAIYHGDRPRSPKAEAGSLKEPNLSVRVRPGALGSGNRHEKGTPTARRASYTGGYLTCGHVEAVSAEQEPRVPGRFLPAARAGVRAQRAAAAGHVQRAGVRAAAS